MQLVDLLRIEGCELHVRILCLGTEKELQMWRTLQVWVLYLRAIYKLQILILCLMAARND